MDVTHDERMSHAYADWLAAKTIIAAFLAEIRPDHDAATREHNAAAILARLAHAAPPLLIARAEDLKE